MENMNRSLDFILANQKKLEEANAAAQQDIVTRKTGATKARFKRRATAVPNSIDRIKFDFSKAVARRLKPSRATAV